MNISEKKIIVVGKTAPSKKKSAPHPRIVTATSTAETSQPKPQPQQQPKRVPLSGRKPHTAAGTSSSNAGPMDDTSEFCGCLINITCNDVTYQGLVTAINAATKSITLTKVLKNGQEHLGNKSVTVKAPSITDLRVVKMPIKDDVAGEKKPVAPVVSPPPKRASTTTNKPLPTVAPTIAPATNGVRVKKQPPQKKGAPVPVPAPKMLQRPITAPAPISFKPMPGQWKNSKPAPPTKQPPPKNSSINNLQMMPRAVIAKNAKKAATTAVNTTPQQQQSTSRVISVNELLQAARPAERVQSEGPAEYKAYGDFKKFVATEVPVPRCLEMGKRVAGVGPSGIPSLDCSNGYRKGGKRMDELGVPINFDEIQEDFNFDKAHQAFCREVLSSSEEEEAGEGALVKEAPVAEDITPAADDHRLSVSQLRIAKWVKECKSASAPPTGIEDGNSTSPPSVVGPPPPPPLTPDDDNSGSGDGSSS